MEKGLLFFSMLCSNIRQYVLAVALLGTVAELSGANSSVQTGGGQVGLSGRISPALHPELELEETLHLRAMC